MSQNPYVKALKSFDPKTQLIVNEKFNVSALGAVDTLSDLEPDDFEQEMSEESGKEAYSYKTGGAISADIVSLENSLNKTILLVTNTSGEIYLLTPESNKLKALVKFKINGSISKTPAYADGVLYCTTKEGAVYAIQTGLKTAQDVRSLKPQVIWQRRMKKGILTEPQATGKLLIIATLAGIYGFEAYYLDESQKSIGKPLWAKGIMGSVVSSPLVHGGLIYLGSEENRLYAFEYGGRKVDLLWSYKSTGGIRVKPYVSQKTGDVLFGTLDGYVYCLEGKTGKYKWNFVTKSPCLSNIISTVEGGEELYYFGADDGQFYCVNSQGKKKWEFKAGGKIRTEALAKNQRIYFGCSDNRLYALDLTTGKELFNFSTDGNIHGKPLVVDDVVYFGSTDSFVHGIHI